MPVQRCREDGKPGYRWGEAGKCYTYEPGDESGRKQAKQRAIVQGEAIGKQADVSVDLLPLEKIKIDEINTQTVTALDRGELLGMHFRLHELWGTHNRENSMEYRYVQPHAMIVGEMVKRGYKHKNVDLLDQLTGIFKSDEDQETVADQLPLEYEDLLKLRSRPLVPVDFDFIVPKSKVRLTSSAESFRAEKLQKSISEFEHHGFYVEPLLDGLRTVIQKKGDQIAITFEDSGVDRLPELIKIDRKIDQIKQLPDFILDGDLSVQGNEGRWTRPQIIRLLQNGGTPEGPAIELVYTVNDLLYWSGTSYNDKPFRERRQALEKLAETLNSVGIHVVPAARANSADSLSGAWKNERYGLREGADGIIIKSAGWVYGVGGRHTPYVVQVKRVVSMIAKVLEARQREGVYDFRAGVISTGVFTNVVDIDGKDYVDLGWSYNSPFGAKEGEIVEVEVQELVVDEGERTLMWMNAVPVNISDNSPTKDVDAQRKAEETKLLGRIPKGFETQFEKNYWIAKSDTERRYTLGIVYPHSEYDSYGHWSDPAEIEKMAWLYMQESPYVGLMHVDGTEYSGYVVESYIYRGPDWQIGNQVVREGDWLLGVIWSPEAWELVRSGYIRGYSLQGYGKTIAATVGTA